MDRNMRVEPVHDADLCDTCGSSGVEIDHTKDGKTVCVNCAGKDQFECQNCGEVWGENELVNPIPDLVERVAPGEPMPAGECPECGALCHALEVLHD